MLIGCHLPTQGPVATREALQTFARAAEEREIASLWVSDHVIFPRTASGAYPGGRFPHAPDTPYLEPVAVLAAAAMVTTRARLGASVFILGHRHPVVMAKLLTTIDTLSQGRLICGVGVGWWREELEILGAPFERRGRQADEILRAIKALWTEDNPRFQGEFFRFRDLGFAPKPVQKPHPPIWVGGHSAAAIRRAARIGDGWHPVGANPAVPLRPAELKASLDQLHRQAEAAGRDPKAIAISFKAPIYDTTLPTAGGERRPFAGTTEQIAGDIREYADLGVSEFVFDFRSENMAESLERMERFAGTVMRAAR
jgi:probable F420-dependent oxidoreductase